jgi:hypothetical protein
MTCPTCGAAITKENRLVPEHLTLAGMMCQTCVQVRRKVVVK